MEDTDHLDLRLLLRLLNAGVQKKIKKGKKNVLNRVIDYPFNYCIS